MKSQILLFSCLFLFFLNCKKESQVVLNTPFKVTVSKEMFVDGFLKGIIVSNSLGDVYFEKVISNIDKDINLEIDILVGEEDKVNLTFIKAATGGAFSNQSFYNLKDGVIFDPQPSFRNFIPDTHEIFIEGVKPETSIEAGLGSIYSKNFENNNLYLEVGYPKNGAFFIFLWEKGDSNHRYIHIQNPESVINLKDSDFLPLSKTKEIKMKVDTFGPNNSEVIGIRDDGDNFPVLGKFDASGNRFSFFEVPAWEADHYRLTISKHNFTFREFVDELPNQFDFVCDLDRGNEGALSPVLFEDEDFSSIAQYFRKQKVFMPNDGPPANHWSLEGIYEENFSFKIPTFSEELEAVIPSLKLPYSVWGESLSHYQFRENNQEIIEKMPFFSEEQLFEWGTYDCSR